MNITVKEAYLKTCKELGKSFEIYSCRELSDRWLFGWCMKDGSAVQLPPISVTKENGIITVYDESGADFLNGDCREMGTYIPIENIINETA